MSEHEKCGAQYGRNPDLCHQPHGHRGTHSNRYGTTWSGPAPSVPDPTLDHEADVEVRLTDAQVDELVVLVDNIAAEEPYALDALVGTVESLIAKRDAEQRAIGAERAATEIEAAGLHVLTNADSDEGAKLTAAILQRAADIARAAGVRGEVSDRG